MSKNKKIVFIIVFFLISSITLKAQSIGLPIVINYNERFPQIKIVAWDIKQNKDGIVFIATDDNIYFFNNQNFVPLSKNMVRFLSLDIDQNNNIYFGSSGFIGFASLENGQYKFSYFTCDNYIKATWSTYCVSEGVYYFISKKDAIYLPSIGQQCIKIKRPENFRFIRAFKIGDTVFVVSQNGIGFIKNGIFKILFDSLDFAHQDIRVLFDLDQNYLLAGTKIGNFYILNLKNKSVRPIELEQQDLLRKSFVYTYAKLNDSTFILGTLKSGLFIYNLQGKLIFRIDKSLGLSSNTIYKILVDNQKNIWIATTSGVSKIIWNTPFSFIDFRNGINGVITGFGLIDNYFLVNTSTGIYYSDLSESFYERNKFKLFSPKFLYQRDFFPIDVNGKTVYVSGGYNYFLVLDKNLNIIDTIKSIKVSAVALPNKLFPSSVVVATFKGVFLFKFEDNNGKISFKKVYKFNEIDDYIDQIIFTNDTLMWMLATGNLYLIKFPSKQPLKNYQFFYYDTTFGFPWDPNMVIFKFRNKIYLSTKKGIYTFKPSNNFNNIFFSKVSDNILSKTISSENPYILNVLETEDKIIIYKPNQLFVYNKDSHKFQAIKTNCQFNKFRNFNYFLALKDNKVYFSDISSVGIFSLQFNEFKNFADFRKTPIILTNVYYKEKDKNFYLFQRCSKSEKINLKFTPLPDLKFVFTLPYYVCDNSFEYSYKLEGLDKEWSEWRKENFLYLKNLSGGKYTLKVRIKNYLTDQIIEGQIQFKVPRPFYATYLAYLIYVFIVVLSIYFIVKIRIRKIKREKQHLEEQIRKRTNILKKQNEKLEQLNQKLKSKEEQLKNETEKLKLLMNEIQQLSLVAKYTDNSVIIFNKYGKVEWWNLAFTKMFDKELKKYKNLPLPVKIKKIRPDVIEKINFIKQNKTKEPITYIHKKEDNNTQYWYKTIINSIYDEQEQDFKGFIVLDIDITDIKLAEKEIENQKKILEEQAEELRQTNLMLIKQKQEILLKNTEITSSIAYAKKIQEALLPHPIFIKALFDEIFIFYKPKAIVSGDFYWFDYKFEKIIAIVGDCTGHGVPGAFMSILSISMIKDILATANEPLKANEILNILREKIIYSLHQRNQPNYTKDGIDMSLLIIDQKNNSFQFAGANSNVFIIDNQQLIELKGDKMPIGIHDLADKPFTNHTYQLKPDYIFYMFTDGFQDQFGGPKNKKYSYKQFKELILKISSAPLSKQEQLLEKELQFWKGNNEQTDDILIVGFIL